MNLKFFFLISLSCAVIARPSLNLSKSGPDPNPQKKNSDELKLNSNEPKNILGVRFVLSPDSAGPNGGQDNTDSSQPASSVTLRPILNLSNSGLEKNNSNSIDITPEAKNPSIILDGPRQQSRIAKPQSARTISATGKAKSKTLRLESSITQSISTESEPTFIVSPAVPVTTTNGPQSSQTKAGSLSNNSNSSKQNLTIIVSVFLAAIFLSAVGYILYRIRNDNLKSKNEWNLLETPKVTFKDSKQDVPTPRLLRPYKPEYHQSNHGRLTNGMIKPIFKGDSLHKHSFVTPRPYFCDRKSIISSNRNSAISHISAILARNPIINHKTRNSFLNHYTAERNQNATISLSPGVLNRNSIIDHYTAGRNTISVSPDILNRNSIIDHNSAGHDQNPVSPDVFNRYSIINQNSAGHGQNHAISYSPDVLNRYSIIDYNSAEHDQNHAISYSPGALNRNSIINHYTAERNQNATISYSPDVLNRYSIIDYNSAEHDQNHAISYSPGVLNRDSIINHYTAERNQNATISYSPDVLNRFSIIDYNSAEHDQNHAISYSPGALNRDSIINHYTAERNQNATISYSPDVLNRNSIINHNSAGHDQNLAISYGPDVLNRNSIINHNSAGLDQNSFINHNPSGLRRL